MRVTDKPGTAHARRSGPDTTTMPNKQTELHPSGGAWRNFYGRFRGKTLRPQQLKDLEEMLPNYALENVEWDQNPEREVLPWQVLSGGKPIWLEIGFGGGEHLYHLAQTREDVFFVGCEPFINGLAMLLGKLRQHPLPNLKIFPGDARHIFDVMPIGLLARAYLLYPDPWPKKRHHRRRFVTPDHLSPLSRVMHEGAELRVATDIEDYARQVLQEVPRQGFIWNAEQADDWRKPWDHWLSTRYEQKALRAGRKPVYLRFSRNPSATPIDTPQICD